VRGICRKQEDIALSNSFALPFAFAIYVFKNNVPLYLEEELVGGVYVEISTSIRASNSHDHEFGVLPNHLSPYWRLKKMAVLFNPAFQIKGSKRLCHVTSLQKWLYISLAAFTASSSGQTTNAAGLSLNHPDRDVAQIQKLALQPALPTGRAARPGLRAAAPAASRTTRKEACHPPPLP